MFTRNEYPRPQLRREEWKPLNGEWQFCYDDNGEGEKRRYSDGKTNFERVINVPYSYQYEASGINETEYHPTVWYKREFSLSKEQTEKTVLLNFNAVDYYCEIWLNGKFAFSHVGGFTPFTVNVTSFVEERNVLVVKCVDTLDKRVPRGKQSWTNERQGCWYIPNTGIWQSVWLEFTGKDYLKSRSVIPSVKDCGFAVELESAYSKATNAEINFTFKGKTVASEKFEFNGFSAKTFVKLPEESVKNGYYLWSIDKPDLFAIEIKLYCGKDECDRLTTRAGLREIAIENGVITLNGKPLYQRLILDQGYFKESGMTPVSAEALKNDVILSKKMGYNGARKHQKFEDPYFYYYADELGFLTWCEMPSAYEFGFTEEQNLVRDWAEIIKEARNFTSVVCYVPLNESWGVEGLNKQGKQQDFARSLYYYTRSLDDSRLVSTNDGWENPETDVVTIHDYSFDSNEFPKIYNPDKLDMNSERNHKIICDGCKFNGQPVLFSEFGGIAMQNNKKAGDWGYNTDAKNDEEFLSRYKNLLSGIQKMWFQGFCYTQLTDCQHEVNGLLDENHNPKFDLEVIRKLTLIEE
mgnify:CR=1 FL=1